MAEFNTLGDAVRKFRKHYSDWYFNRSLRPENMALAGCNDAEKELTSQVIKKLHSILVEDQNCAKAIGKCAAFSIDTGRPEAHVVENETIGLIESKLSSLSIFKDYNKVEKVLKALNALFFTLQQESSTIYKSYRTFYASCYAIYDVLHAHFA